MSVGRYEFVVPAVASLSPPARFGRGGEEDVLVVSFRFPEPQVPQPLLVQELEDEQQDRGHYPDGEADEDEHHVAHVEGGRLADAKLLVYVELNVICPVESPVDDKYRNISYL